ncbi:addiction module toxin, HicA family [Acidobacteria bacterium ACD]|nr:MAG: type II toxin-antitoxin system HicA family toxin [Acidobacteriota bacterium]MCE7957436.1 type II toxin-antitoxin system HicA family toxin [Acidobacteria bacterium ACB2]MDL1950595.1 addiction module toxin, HicA family [Acidobacteria bacterium ACD]
MPPLPIISGTTCIAALERLGYQAERSRGSHVWLTAPGRPSVPVPLHRTLDRGTLRMIIRTAGLTVEEFLRLL